MMLPSPQQPAIRLYSQRLTIFILPFMGNTVATIKRHIIMIIIGWRYKQNMYNQTCTTVIMIITMTLVMIMTIIMITIMMVMMLLLTMMTMTMVMMNVHTVSHSDKPILLNARMNVSQYCLSKFVRPMNILSNVSLLFDKFYLCDSLVSFFIEYNISIFNLFTKRNYIISHSRWDVCGVGPLVGENDSISAFVSATHHKVGTRPG